MPSLANLVAIRDADPSRLAAVRAHLESSEEFAAVWSPAESWVSALSPLPGGPPADPLVTRAGFAVVEDQAALFGSPTQAGRLRSVVERLADPGRRLAEIAGDFGFVFWDEIGGMTAARSCGGRVPLYYREEGTRFALATRITDLARFAFPNPVIDPLVAALWAVTRGHFPDRRSPVEGVEALPRGSILRAGRGRTPRRETYWSPVREKVDPATVEAAESHAEELREILLRTLERELWPGEGNLLTLSGGVDSSSLAVLAAETLGRDLWSWSFLPQKKESYEREMAYIAPLSKKLGISRQWQTIFRPGIRVELIRRGPPLLFPILHPALCSLPALCRQAEIRVLFGGEFADEIVGSRHLTLPDWLSATSAWSLMASAGRWPNGPRDGLRWLSSRWREWHARPSLPLRPELPEFIRRKVREEYAEWRQTLLREQAGRLHSRRYLELRSRDDGFLGMNWEACSTLGVRRFFPMFSREILELAFRCHPRELVGPGDKRLLRRALRDIVPARYLSRKGKESWEVRGSRIPWNEALPTPLASVLDRRWLERPPATVSMEEGIALAALTRLADSVGGIASGFRAQERTAAIPTLTREAS